MAIKYIGLDFEASGTNPWGDHVPIQLGISTLTEDGGLNSYQNLIGGWNWNEFEWSDEAFEVHNITKEQLEREAPVWVVDVTAASWLIKTIGYKNRMWNVCVGWNVAGYDRQFITRWMPNLNRILSYRNVDLNTLCFGLSSGSESVYNAYKRNSKEYARNKLEALGLDEGWHDALYDAQAALFSYEFLTDKKLGIG